MKKIIISLAVLLVLSLAVVYYFFSQDYSKDSSSHQNVLANPSEGLTDEQAIQSFNESFVYYILSSVKAYNLHNPPFSSDTPKIIFSVEKDVYSAEVASKKIIVYRNSIENPDVIIKTSRAEAVKMTRDPDYIKESFSQGKSSLEMSTGKETLALKGYLGISKQFGLN